jgi:hypothetical protein
MKGISDLRLGVRWSDGKVTRKRVGNKEYVSILAFCFQ